MSGESWALQQLVYAALVADAGVGALIGDRIYDNPPKSAEYPFASFGPSDTVMDDADCIDGRVETLQIDIWSQAKDGKREAKLIVDAVKAALHGFAAEPTAGALVDLQVVQLRVMDDPDPTIKHGVVVIEATIEDAV